MLNNQNKHLQKIEQMRLSLIKGLLSIGIGKKGNRYFSDELKKETDKIFNFLCSSKTNYCDELFYAQFGAFLGAYSNHLLFHTNDQKQTKALFSKSQSTIDQLLQTKAIEIQDNTIYHIIINLLQGKKLSEKESYYLGTYLFTDNSATNTHKTFYFIAGLTCSSLRVRYEGIDEYIGLIKSIHNNAVQDEFKKNRPHFFKQKIIQIAEPFDGTNRSYLITPIIAQILYKNSGYKIIVVTGRSSGPKYGNNVLDVISLLEKKTCQSFNEIFETKEVSYIDISTAIPILNRWTDIRQAIIKRPFLATIEKFINVSNADYLLTSAFHRPYVSKMLDIAYHSSINNKENNFNTFKKTYVIGRGNEGSIGFSSKNGAIMGFRRKKIRSK